MLLTLFFIVKMLLISSVNSKATLLQDDLSTLHGGVWAFWPPYIAPTTSSYCPTSSSTCFEIGGTGWFYATVSTVGYKDIVVKFDISSYGYSSSQDYCQLIYTTDYGITWDTFGPQYTSDTSDTLTLTPPEVQDSDYFGFGWQNFASSESKLCFVSNVILLGTLPNTNNPTVEPTNSPSHHPTETPSQSPTITTETPSLHPTLYPTTNPIITSNPTTNPTSDPTSDPTRDPTFDPTFVSTFDPTSDPSTNPSSNPSNYPSIIPTNNPTDNPSMNPTNNPTNNAKDVDTTFTSTSFVDVTGKNNMTDKGPKMLWSNYIPAIVVGSCFVLMCFLGIYHSKKHDYQFLVSNVIWVGYHSLDFLTDLLFILFLFHDGEIGLFIIALIFVVLSSVVSVIQLNINMKVWISNSRDNNEWLQEYATFLYAICFICGCQPAMHLCTSNFLELRAFSLSLSKYHQTKLYNAHLWSMVVCENVPQLTLEIIYIVNKGNVNDITLLAMVFSGCSILMAPCIYITRRQLMIQHKMSEDPNHYVELQ